MNKLRVHTIKIVNYKERRLIDATNHNAESLSAALPFADQWASEVLPDTKWGRYFRIPTNGVWCRRSMCREYQQTIWKPRGEQCV